MTCVFTLQDFGRSFATRGRGEELRDALLKRCSSTEAITIDFAGISHVSYSFADEFIGKLVEQKPGIDLRLENFEGSVAQTVARARANRAAIC